MKYTSKNDSVYDGMSPLDILITITDALRIHCNSDDEAALKWALDQIADVRELLRRRGV